FRRLLAEGAFNAAFVPLFSSILSKEGQAQAQVAAQDIFSVFVAFLIGLVFIFELIMPQLMYLLAPGFKASTEKFQILTEFARISFPYILFIALAAFYSGILNTYHKFAIASGAPLLLNVAMIAAVLFFSDIFSSPGYALSAALIIAG